VCAKPRVRVAEVEEPPQLEAAVGIRKGGANAESPPRPSDRRIEFLWMFRYRPQPFRRFSAFSSAISARDIARKVKSSWRLMPPNRSRGERTCLDTLCAEQTAVGRRHPIEGSVPDGRKDGGAQAPPDARILWRPDRCHRIPFMRNHSGETTATGEATWSQLASQRVAPRFILNLFRKLSSFKYRRFNPF